MCALWFPTFFVKCVRTVVWVAGLMLMTTMGVSPSDAATLPFTADLFIQIGNPFLLLGAGAGMGTSIGGGGIAQIPADAITLSNSHVLFPPIGPVDGYAVCAPGLPPGTKVTVPSGNTACPQGQSGTNDALSFNGVTGMGGVNASGYATVISQIPAQGEVPLAVFGVPGSFETFTFVGHDVSARGSQWDLGTITVSGVFLGTLITLKATGIDNRSSDGTGVLQLVTPVIFDVIGWGEMPATATLKLDFMPPAIPEPASALLLGLGLAGLLVLGRRRMRQ